MIWCVSPATRDVTYSPPPTEASLTCLLHIIGKKPSESALFAPQTLSIPNCVLRGYSDPVE